MYLHVCIRSSSLGDIWEHVDVDNNDSFVVLNDAIESLWLFFFSKLRNM